MDENKKPVILLTNDDGIHSLSWKYMMDLLSEWADAVAIVPEYEQSGKAISITLNEPLRIRKHEDRLFSTNGTPADCINLGISIILEGKKPDIIVSGINKGLNIAQDILYSGTFGAALEGYTKGIVSFALSLDYKKDGIYADYLKASELCNGIVSEIINRIKQPYLYNVNLPFDSRYYTKDRVRITRLGCREYEDLVIMRKDPRNRPYYWYSGNKQKIRHDELSDICMIKKGYISITPLKALSIDENALGELSGIFNGAMK